MHQYLAEFLTIALVHILAVASPGPDFAVVVRQSVLRGKTLGLYTSVGIGLGILVHVAYCLIGLGMIISQSILLFNAIKYLGAAYLVYIGLSALLSKQSHSKVLTTPKLETQTNRQALLLGFLTNALNPKATIFFLAVFSVVVNPNTPILVQLAYGLWMVVSSIAWFSLVTIFFSGEKVRSAFERTGHWFEKVMGTLLIALGARLAFVEINE